MENKLKELKKLIDTLLEETSDELEEELADALKKVHKEKAFISVKKNADGTATTKLEGTTMSILVALAGLEQNILKQTKVPKDVWEIIRDCVSTKEAE